jgi:hypothetical protein
MMLHIEGCDKEKNCVAIVTAGELGDGNEVFPGECISLKVYLKSFPLFKRVLPSFSNSYFISWHCEPRQTKDPALIEGRV